MSLSYAVANPELPLIYSVKIGQLFNANGFFIIKAVILLLEYAPNLYDYVKIGYCSTAGTVARSSHHPLPLDPISVHNNC